MLQYYSPLDWAAIFGNVHIAQILIDYGVNVNEHLEGSLKTPLHFAVKNAHIELCKLLISAGGNLNAKTKKECFSDMVI